MIKLKDPSGRHRKTFDDVVSLINYLGGKVKNGNGSRHRFVLSGTLYLTHQPHPGNEMDKGAVVGLREWLENSVGVNYE